MYSTSCTGQREHGRSHRRIAGIGWLHERWTSLFKWTGVPILSAHTYRWLETSITKGEHNENALLEETGGHWLSGGGPAPRSAKKDREKNPVPRPKAVHPPRRAALKARNPTQPPRRPDPDSTLVPDEPPDRQPPV